MYPVHTFSNHIPSGTDTLIVDSKADLNIYTMAKDENQGSNCCGERAEHPCCEKSPSCCNEGESVADNISALSELNLNELAGM